MGREDEEEDVSSYWMTSRKPDDCWKLKEEARDRNVWRNRLEKGYDIVVRENMG
jgi:hypothetical protein